MVSFSRNTFVSSDSVCVSPAMTLVNCNVVRVFRNTLRASSQKRTTHRFETVISWKAIYISWNRLIRVSYWKQRRVEYLKHFVVVRLYLWRFFNIIRIKSSFSYSYLMKSCLYLMKLRRIQNIIYTGIHAPWDDISWKAVYISWNS